MCLFCLNRKSKREVERSWGGAGVVTVSSFSFVGGGLAIPRKGECFVYEIHDH